MAGLLEQMRASEQARNQELLSHTPQRQLTGRQIADAMQTVGLLASPLPVIGDVAGLLGDAAMYAAKPEERTLGNFAMTALGALPFVPNASSLRVFRGQHGLLADSSPFEATKRPLPSFTTDPKVAEQYAHGAGNFGVPVSGGKVSQYDLDASKFLDVRGYLADGRRFNVEDALTPASIRQLAADLKLNKRQTSDLLENDAWSRKYSFGWDAPMNSLRRNTPAAMPASELIDSAYSGRMFLDALRDRGISGVALRGSLLDPVAAGGRAPWTSRMTYDEFRPLNSSVLRQAR